MLEKKIIDYLISGTLNEELALIDVETGEFIYEGKIVENKLPESLLKYVKDFHEAIGEMTFSVLDDLEKRVYFYDLRLKQTGCKIHHLYINDSYISFYTKYPSGTGFLESRPRI